MKIEAAWLILGVPVNLTVVLKSVLQFANHYGLLNETKLIKISACIVGNFASHKLYLHGTPKPLVKKTHTENNSFLKRQICSGLLQSFLIPMWKSK